MAGFNRVQKQKAGTGLVYIRFRKTMSEEQMMDYAPKRELRFERLAKEYDAGLFLPANEEDITELCKKLMRDYDYVFIAREYTE